VKFYAGVGSRRAPDWALDLAERVATRLRAEGWTLRSGHAPGMDQAFERGAGVHAEIFLPWPGFEGQVTIEAYVKVDEPPLECYEIAAKYHPNWHSLRRGGQRLHARNVSQILGRTGSECTRENCSQYVVCWTPDGSLDGYGPDTGGTGQALRIAVGMGVPVFNLALPEHRARLERIAAPG
jgi:hypothetical protein